MKNMHKNNFHHAWITTLPKCFSFKLATHHWSEVCSIAEWLIDLMLYLLKRFIIDICCIWFFSRKRIRFTSNPVLNYKHQNLFLLCKFENDWIWNTLLSISNLFSLLTNWQPIMATLIMTSTLYYVCQIETEHFDHSCL